MQQSLVEYCDYVGSLVGGDNEDITRSLIRKGNPFKDMTLKGFILIGNISLYDAFYHACGLQHLAKIKELKKDVALELLSFLKKIHVEDYRGIKRKCVVVGSIDYSASLLKHMSNNGNSIVQLVNVKSSDISQKEAEFLNENFKVCDEIVFHVVNNIREAVLDVIEEKYLEKVNEV